VSHERLVHLPLFSDLTSEELDILEAGSRETRCAAGEALMREGSAGGSLYVILEGDFEISKRSGKNDVVIAVRGPGEVIGEMSLLDGSPRTATVRSLHDSRLLEIDQATFQELIETSPTAAIRILRTMTSRLRHTQSMLRQSETLAALGTLSAGLAHELNNPAAALRRAVDQLRTILPRWREAHVVLHEAGVDESRQPDIAAFAFPGEVGPRRIADPLARADEEAAVQDWLEAQGVGSAWELAPALVASGVDVAALAALIQELPPDGRAAAVGWIAASRTLQSLLEEVSISADRISEIVGAVRSYTYLDQAPVQKIDIHRGLEDTLIILRSKLEPGIVVHRAYAPDLPSIEAHGSELNQAWTNLIANAAEAMEGKGEIRIRTAVEDQRALVEICDNGPGIPEAIRDRIFEPFFTTKPPGEGTGLGLHITYNVIALHHHGQISVESEPGRTCFQVRLPLQLEPETK
jgi:signal transduction histidine kinase